MSDATVLAQKFEARARATAERLATRGCHPNATDVDIALAEAAAAVIAYAERRASSISADHLADAIAELAAMAADLANDVATGGGNADTPQVDEIVGSAVARVERRHEAFVDGLARRAAAIWQSADRELMALAR